MSLWPILHILLLWNALVHIGVRTWFIILTKQDISLQKPSRENWGSIQSTVIFTFMNGNSDIIVRWPLSDWRTSLLTTMTRTTVTMLKTTTKWMVNMLRTLAEVNMDINRHVEEDVQPGGCTERSREEDDKEEKSSTKILKRDFEEFMSSDFNKHTQLVRLILTVLTLRCRQ